MGEHSGPTVDGPVYSLRLANFSAESRKAAINALMTLSSLGIGPEEIARGSANAPPEHYQDARTHFESGKHDQDWEDMNALVVRRVGLNYVDFEIPTHDSPPVSTFVYDSMPDIQRRAREMGEEDGVRVARVYDNYGLGGDTALEAVMHSIEATIYDTWRQRWAEEEESRKRPSEKHQ